MNRSFKHNKERIHGSWKIHENERKHGSLSRSSFCLFFLFNNFWVLIVPTKAGGFTVPLLFVSMQPHTPNIHTNLQLASLKNQFMYHLVAFLLFATGTSVVFSKGTLSVITMSPEGEEGGPEE